MFVWSGSDIGGLCRHCHHRPANPEKYGFNENLKEENEKIAKIKKHCPDKYLPAMIIGRYQGPGLSFSTCLGLGLGPEYGYGHSR